MAPLSPTYPEEKSPEQQVTPVELHVWNDGLIPVLKESPSDHPEAVVEQPQVVYGSGLEWVPRLEYNIHIADKPVEVVKKEPFGGLGKKRFWILIGVAVVVVLAAVGGGVGGAMAAKGGNGGNLVVNGTSTASTTAPPATDTPSPTTLQTSTTTTKRTGTPSPTSRALFYITLYKEVDFKGQAQEYTTSGSFNLTASAFAPQSFILETSANGTLSGMCVMFCANALAVGGPSGNPGQPRCESTRVSPIDTGGNGNITMLFTGQKLEQAMCFSG